MKALILAAGIGKRLRPLTNRTPKALIEIGGRPLLHIAIEYLAKYGFDEIIINVHHYADQIIKYLEVNQYFGHNILISDETDQLLDTGGALKKTAWFFDDDKPFLIYNVDILCDLDLGQFYRHHQESGALATLAVRKRASERYLLFDEANILCGWQNFKTGEIVQTRPSDLPPRQLAFSGISVLSPEILRHLPRKNVFSLIDLYLRLAPKYTIKGFQHNESLWLDVGNPENLAKASEFFTVN
ncbi:MAG TPA: nucleotidyltransferase family protein [Candidatus Marinimicrobia bacterium]|nr:nucleotidyltransferase family protein [Candidatus Neomarinimicrobiota bacterium]HRS51625.1 nucleotidyltransferase family protein [Candidatus Neomarinimicrobiota bacterium]HRU92297.1 nucleotidyltransferase family protein [Candidatus Neomarinimicrobiota bacterium]